MLFSIRDSTIAARLHEELTSEGEWVGDRMDAIWSLFTPNEWDAILSILDRVAERGRLLAEIDQNLRDLDDYGVDREPIATTVGLLLKYRLTLEGD
jgi:hypothetical protein